MKRSVQALGVPLMLAVGFGLAVGQGDTRSPYALAQTPGTLGQALTLKALTPAPRVTRRSRLPFAPVPHGPGDVIPRCYLVFGLQSGRDGTHFTDRNGAVIPVPSNARIFLNPPFNRQPIVPPQALPPTYTNPRIYTFPRISLPPAPKK